MLLKKKEKIEKRETIGETGEKFCHLFWTTLPNLLINHITHILGIYIEAPVVIIIYIRVLELLLLPLKLSHVC